MKTTVLTIAIASLLFLTGCVSSSNKSDEKLFRNVPPITAADRYMNDHEAALLRALSNYGIDIKRNENTLTLIMTGDISFASNSAKIRPKIVPALEQIAGVLNKFSDTHIKVEGHTDNAGSEKYNLGLSERRANAVTEVLRNYNVSSKRLTTLGMGEYHPRATNETKEGKRLNRRVELIIQPTENVN